MPPRDGYIVHNCIGLAPPPEKAKQQTYSSCYEERLKRSLADLAFESLAQILEALPPLRIVLSHGFLDLGPHVLHLSIQWLELVRL